MRRKGSSAMSYSQSMNGKRIVLIGATGAVGSVIAEHLAKRGATLVLIGRDQRSLEDIQSRLPSNNHISLSFNINENEDWLNALPSIAPNSQIDGLVTTVGVVTPIGRFRDIDIEQFTETINVNLISTLRAIKFTYEALSFSGGSIVAFSGGGATSPLPRYDAYAASKIALVRLCENLAPDLGESGIRINAIAPGFIRSKMHSATLTVGPSSAGDEYFKRTQRILAENAEDNPDRAAKLTEFLLSDLSVGITGRLISAIWDPWEDREYQDLLRNDLNFATLRRIDNQFYFAGRNPA